MDEFRPAPGPPLSGTTTRIKRIGRSVTITMMFNVEYEALRAVDQLRGLISVGRKDPTWKGTSVTFTDPITIEEDE